MHRWEASTTAVVGGRLGREDQWYNPKKVTKEKMVDMWDVALEKALGSRKDGGYVRRGMRKGIGKLC